MPVHDWSRSWDWIARSSSWHARRRRWRTGPRARVRASCLTGPHGLVRLVGRTVTSLNEYSFILVSQSCDEALAVWHSRQRGAKNEAQGARSVIAVLEHTLTQLITPGCPALGLFVPAIDTFWSLRAPATQQPFDILHRHLAVPGLLCSLGEPHSGDIHTPAEAGRWRQITIWAALIIPFAHDESSGPFSTPSPSPDKAPKTFDQLRSYLPSSPQPSTPPSPPQSPPLPSSTNTKPQPPPPQPHTP